MRNILALLLAIPLLASENLLFEALKETSTLATRTKLNIDDMPSTITVIQSDDLIRSSALTLHDALKMVTGVDATKAFNGWKTVNIRGVATPKSFGFDKIKLTIDGVDVTSHLYETIYYYLDMSVDLIERVEILRGPASSVYGAGAFAGAINVVTKLGEMQKGSTGSVRVGNKGYRAVSALGVWSVGGWKIGVDAYRQGDKATAHYPAPINEDKGGFGGVSHQGFIDEMVGFRASSGGLKISARIKSVEYENSTGNAVYPAVNDGKNNKNQFAFVELKHESAPYKELDLGIRAGFREYIFDNKISLFDIDRMRARLYSDEKIKSYVGSLFPSDKDRINAIDGNTTDYKRAYFYSKERSFYGEVVANYDYSWIKPTVGLYIENSRNIDNDISTNYTNDQIMSSVTNPQIVWGDMERFSDSFVGNRSHDRTVTALFLQNIITITDSLDLTIGARGDHCSDMKQTLPSYRAGGVYRLNDTSRIKLMAGHAFRAPSLIELYSNGAEGLIPQGNSDLKAETIDTVELSYRKRLVGGALGVGLFYSVQEDAIDTNSSRGKFFNFPDRTTKGVEFEYEQKISAHHRIGFNYTFLEATTTGSQPFSEEKNPKMAEVATKIGNIFHSWYLPHNIQLNTNIRYTGARVQSKNIDHPQDKTDHFVVFNEALSWEVDRKTDIKLTVENLFNTRTTTASLYGLHRGGTPEVSRRVYLGVSHKF